MELPTNSWKAMHVGRCQMLQDVGHLLLLSGLLSLLGLHLHLHHLDKLGEVHWHRWSCLSTRWSKTRWGIALTLNSSHG